MHKTQGATVWQILGVIVIILAVAAILLSTLDWRTVHTSPQTICLSNQKQLGLAFLQYTQDYDELMPNISDTPGGRHTWRAAIYPYVKSYGVYRCPDDTAPDAPDGFPPSYAANYSGDYNGTHWDKGNGALAGPGSQPLSQARFPDPSQLILLCEVQNSAAPEFNIDSLARFPSAQHILAPRHNNGGSYLLADGHAHWYNPLATARLWYRDPRRPLSPNALAVLRDARMAAPARP